MTRLSLLLATIGLGLVTIAMLEHRSANAGLPLVHADYEACATVRTPPLLRTPEGKADYRLGSPFNDKGIS